MKHIRRFIEKNNNLEDPNYLSFNKFEKNKVLETINDLSYILEDEGYLVRKWINLADGGLCITFSKKCIKEDFITPEVEEFFDRLKSDLSEFVISYPKNGINNNTPLVFKSADWSVMGGDYFMNISIRKKSVLSAIIPSESIIFESTIEKSDILDIIQELVDNGFSSKIQICYCSEDFSPFKTTEGQWGDKIHPGKQSFVEFKGGLKSYLVKLSYKDGVEFEEFEKCHFMFVEALDRLEDLGKVFKKVHVITNPNNGLIRPSFEILIISKEKSESGRNENFTKLLKDNGITCERYSGDDAFIIYINNRDLHDGLSKGRYRLEEIRTEKFKRYDNMCKKIKSICKGKFRTGTSHDSNYNCIVILHFQANK